MANIYVKSTTGNNGNSGATWLLAKATLAGAVAIAAAGDTIWLSQAHAESTAGALSWTFPGTLTNPVRVLCGNDALEPPQALATTATVASTGTTNITFAGTIYVYGVAFTAGTTGSPFIFINNTTSHKQTFESSDLIIGGNGASGTIVLGSQSSIAANEVHLNNCRFKFAGVGQGLQPACKARINGGSLISGGSSPTNFIATWSNNRPFDLIVTGFDFSNASATLNLCVGGTMGSGGTGKFRYCKTPASWSGSLVSAAITNPGARLEMIVCDAGSTNWRFESQDYGGSVKTETTLIRTGGASDGTTPISWKLTTPAAVNYPATFLETPEIVKWNDVVGSPITVKLHILRDSATPLTDKEAAIRVEYMSASGSPLATMIEDDAATAIAAATDQTASAEAWTTTGMSNPDKREIGVTFTPQQKGYIIASGMAFKPSATFYLCPKIDDGSPSSRQAMTPSGQFVNETGSGGAASYSRGRVVNAGAV